jgi:hypothetical protein
MMMPAPMMMQPPIINIGPPNQMIPQPMIPLDMGGMQQPQNMFMQPGPGQ